MKNWKAYERLVSLFYTEEYINNEFFTVIPNARINGNISKRKRQIDILIDCRFDSNLNRRIIIDTKLRKRPIDIKEVEAFEGMMKDVSANKGYLVCSNGYTKSALRRAQEKINIHIIQESELDNFDLSNWEACYSGKCESGLVLWNNTSGIFHDDTVTVQSLGKCDGCGKFHIWCWGCGSRHCIEYESDWRCVCTHRCWFWITAIEPDQDENGISYNSHYLIIVYFNGNYDIVDRRPI